MHTIGGFTFLEVLISLVLLSITLLGLDAMEVYSLRSLRATYFVHLALLQLQNMYDRLLVAKPYHEISQQVIAWNKENQALLPEGKGYVEGYASSYTIHIAWGGEVIPCAQSVVAEKGCIRWKVRV